jgi:hypothetical protein
LSACELSGGVRLVKGCMRAASSSGMSLAGTARSSTGKIGAPVVRSSTNIIPVLVAWTTAGTCLPSRVSVTSAGGEALS